MITSRHFRDVLNSSCWCLTWALCAVISYNHLHHHIGVYAYVFVFSLLAWNNVKGAFSKWQHGVHQKSLQVRSQTPSDIHGAARLEHMGDHNNAQS